MNITPPFGGVDSFNLYGVDIFPNANLLERIQINFPRSKKKRIVKKWLKDEKNWTTVPMKQVLVTPMGMFCHPEIMEIIKRQFPEVKP